MIMPSVEIIISASGASQIQTAGFSGASCRAGSEFIERALGATVHEQLLPQFYESQVASETTLSEQC